MPAVKRATRLPRSRVGEGLRVGLLGGSFNPAHDGHLIISEIALKRLKLDEVWWLVSPQNPLKSTDDMAPLKVRLRDAKRLTKGRRIRPTDIEVTLGTRYTVDTLAALKARFPKTRFVWLMGADNLVEISRWRRWRAIFRGVAIAVLARPSYSLRALQSRAARRFRRARLRPILATWLPSRNPPAWVFLRTPRSAVSATRLRAERAAARPASRSSKS